MRETGLVKPLRLFLLGVAFAAIFPACSASAKPDWLTDFKQAQAEAKAQKKLLLVDFTGSDWCGWCIRLEREVFSKPEFEAYASKNLILLEIDFPRGKAQSAELKQQNQQLAQQLGIQGFPTMVVFDHEGKPVGALGYTPGGPEAFLAALEKLRDG